MKIVIANLNELKGPDISFVVKMLRVTDDLGINPPIYVRSPGSLLSYLKENKEHEILLFSNFPPDRSFPDDELNHRSSSFDFEDFDKRASETYSKSIFLLAKIGIGCGLSAIHLFTCASPQIVSDEFLRSLAPGIPVMIKRTEDVKVSESYFSLIYSKYIIDKVKEAVSQTD